MNTRTKKTILALAPMGLIALLVVACGSGSGGGGVPKKCPDHLADPEILETVSGSNGTFTDECDANGDLIDYECGVDAEWTCDEWECYDDFVRNDEVVPTTVKCAGTCNNGVCASVCPADGAQVQFDSLTPAGHGVVHEVGTQKKWACDTVNVTFTTAAAVNAYLNVTLTVNRAGWSAGQLCLEGTPGHMRFEGAATSAPAVHWSCVVM